MNSDPEQNTHEKARKLRRLVFLAIITALAGILAVLSLLNDAALSAIVYKAF